MNFSLKPNPLIAVWLPGFATLTAVLFFGNREAIPTLLQQSPSPAIVGALSFLAIVFGFVVGELLDTARDLLEFLIDIPKRFRINWDFFVAGERDKIENLEEWYYTWYELDANLALGILLNFLLSWFSIITIVAWMATVMWILFGIFLLGAGLIRNEVKKEIDKNFQNIGE
jgi:hypothetical protein